MCEDDSVSLVVAVSLSDRERLMDCDRLAVMLNEGDLVAESLAVGVFEGVALMLELDVTDELWVADGVTVSVTLAVEDCDGLVDCVSVGVSL